MLYRLLRSLLCALMDLVHPQKVEECQPFLAAHSVHEVLIAHTSVVLRVLGLLTKAFVEPFAKHSVNQVEGDFLVVKSEVFSIAASLMVVSNVLLI